MQYDPRQVVSPPWNSVSSSIKWVPGQDSKVAQGPGSMNSPGSHWLHHFLECGLEQCTTLGCLQSATACQLRNKYVGMFTSVPFNPHNMLRGKYPCSLHCTDKERGEETAHGHTAEKRPSQDLSPISLTQRPFTCPRM